MMATRIIFAGDVALVVSDDLDHVQESVYDALTNGGWMVVRPEDGPSVSINPQRILYMEEFNLAESQAATRSRWEPAGAH